ncbi:MAG: Gfo/Idh/MocA family oxidoreductase [Oscillospiraceae bacterium]|nr:Gfo/Idh/MocA family oxidoreductase [Oscillospiraceae bacterium]MDD7469585.1 Gfo/Idh/MocA family oxidoreductase [Oscillospiraceae bacterium]MDY2677670.1 Gfo/Idh/MocA family oxidoreductase [Oscillospiraceae bacterium]
MEKINVVVVGYGGMGGYHADRILEMEKFNLLGIYDIKEERRKAAEEKGIYAYPSFESVLEDKRVELITCAAYNDCHKEIAIRAMEAGINVISEKPVTLCSEDLEEMIAASKRTGKLFTVHQNRRWDNDYRTIKNIYDNGELGKVHAIDSKVYGSRGIPGDWRREKRHGGGMVLDWGVHLLDQILMLNEGKKLVSVYATLTNVTNDEVDDGFRAIIKFENGPECLVEVFTNNFIEAPRWYMAGENGTAVIEDWDLNGKIVKIQDWEKIDAVPIQAGAGITKTMAPRTDETIKEFPLEKIYVKWTDYYNNIYDVIRNGAKPLITHDQQRRLMKLMEAIFKSAEENRTVYFD